MYDRILVPTDGSDVAATAAAAAIDLAARFDADLHVLHVLELGERGPAGGDEAADELAHLGEQSAASIADRAAEAGVTATAAVLEDAETLHRAILGYAADNGVDCIVMGTHGRTGLGRFVLGSVAEETLRESPIPVLTVHVDSPTDLDFDSVLVPTDGSDHALAAADHAIDLAAASDATLHVVNAVDATAVYDGESPGVVLDALEDAGERAIEAVVERAEAAGLSRIETAVLHGSPYRVIAEYAADEGLGCIVMGTHGRTGVGRYLLGSVTERVVRLSEVPVVAIGSGDAE